MISEKKMLGQWGIRFFCPSKKISGFTYRSATSDSKSFMRKEADGWQKLNVQYAAKRRIQVITGSSIVRNADCGSVMIMPVPEGHNARSASHIR